MWVKFTAGFQVRGKKGANYIKGQVRYLPSSIAAEAIDIGAAEETSAPKLSSQQGSVKR